MNQQIVNFEINLVELYFLKGVVATKQLIQDSLYAVVIGGNDYINNYLQSVFSPTKNVYTPEAFQQLLLTTLSGQLTVRPKTLAPLSCSGFSVN
jgi:hypothetical protein